MENTLSLLTKEELFAKKGRAFRVVELPGGGTVRIRSLKSAEISGWQASMLDPKTGEPCIKRQKQSRERLVALSLVDDNGTPIIGKEDLPELDQLPNSIIGKIAVAAQELNGIDGDDSEDILGNSEGTPADE